jgi:hypothetical protein
MKKYFKVPVSALPPFPTDRPFETWEAWQFVASQIDRYGRIPESITGLKERFRWGWSRIKAFQKTALVAHGIEIRSQKCSKYSTLDKGNKSGDFSERLSTHSSYENQRVRLPVEAAVGDYSEINRRFSEPSPYCTDPDFLNKECVRTSKEPDPPPPQENTHTFDGVKDREEVIWNGIRLQKGQVQTLIDDFSQLGAEAIAAQDREFRAQHPEWKSRGAWADLILASEKWERQNGPRMLFKLIERCVNKGFADERIHRNIRHFKLAIPPWLQNKLPYIIDDYRRKNPIGTAWDARKHHANHRTNVYQSGPPGVAKRQKIADGKLNSIIQTASVRGVTRHETDRFDA